MARVRTITTMAELQAALQAAFNAINRDFYNSELEKVIITVKEGRRKGAYGWIETAKNWRQNGKERYEINISVDYIGERAVEDTIGTLMHEMVHLYNLMHGIKDTTRSGIYHNKSFKAAAEKHGLICWRADMVGFGQTAPETETRKWIAENVKIKSFNVYKQTAEKKEGASKPKQSYRKYICPQCGLIVRATKECQIGCLDCMEGMKLES